MRLSPAYSVHCTNPQLLNAGCTSAYVLMTAYVGSGYSFITLHGPSQERGAAEWTGLTVKVPSSSNQAEPHMTTPLPCRPHLGHADLADLDRPGWTGSDTWSAAGPAKCIAKASYFVRATRCRVWHRAAIHACPVSEAACNTAQRASVAGFGARPLTRSPHSRSAPKSHFSRPAMALWELAGLAVLGEA